MFKFVLKNKFKKYASTDISVSGKWKAISTDTCQAELFIT